MIAVPRLHAVTDATVLARADFLDRVASLRPLGSILAIQVRDRTATGDTLSRQAQAVAAQLEGSDVRLIVNARPDIAAGTGAHGVQLGEGDLATVEVQSAFPQLAIGRSVHSLDEALAESAAQWLVLGAIFPTASHPNVMGQGLGLVRQVAHVSKIPVIAIGGISAERASQVRQAGAFGVAAIRAIWNAPDSLAAARALLEPWAGA